MKKKLENEVLNPRLLSVRNQNLTHLLKDVTSWSAWPLYRTRIITRAKRFIRVILCISEMLATLYTLIWHKGQRLLLRIATLFINCYKRYGSDKLHISKAFKNFAELRIRRYQNASRIPLNGKIFQQQGLLRVIRNMLVKNFGPRLMEKDWIYENKNFNRI